MDAVLGPKPATEPPVIVESQAGAEPTTMTAEDNTEDDMDEDTGSKSDEQETRSNTSSKYREGKGSSKGEKEENNVMKRWTEWRH